MSYSSTRTLVKDIVETLKGKGYCCDDLPNTSVAPNKPVFRVGVNRIQPKQDALDNTDKSSTNVTVVVAYVYPISGGNPQSSEVDICTGVEGILDALANSEVLDSGCAISFTDCRIRQIRPAYLRADIYFSALVNLA